MSTLYVLATPIGNLKDISLRALEMLKEVDFIICEDTRVTSKLLARYEIQKSLVSYFQHSKKHKVDEIIKRLQKGENAALVTDAGTPGISDPGGQLVKQINQLTNQEINIVPIPGACAATAALSISGFPTDKFLFLGFPPHKKGRQKFWKRVMEADETVVFYESCHRIVKSLQELQTSLREVATSLGDEISDQRQIVVCRELTKMYESVYRGTIDEILEKIKKDPQKGEYVVIVSLQ